MYQLVLSDTYLESYENMSKQQKKIILNSLKQFAREDRGNNFQIHRLNREDCDPTFWSARFNQNLRLIFSHQNDRYVLLYIGNHDDAYQWARNKYLHKNPFNAVYVYDQGIEIKYDKGKDIKKENNKSRIRGVLDSLEVKKKDLQRLGLTEKFSEILLACDNEDTYLQLIEVLPKEVQQVLFDIYLGDMSITEAYTVLNTSVSKEEDAFNNNSSRNRFYVVEDEEDLDRVLDSNFERWKLFLHPSQSDLVKRNYNGPVIIEGGPGTGKTVVGLHRAVHLSKEVYKKSDGKKILLCTYSNKLSTYIGDKLLQLTRLYNIKSNIDVRSVDSLIYYLLRRNNIEINAVSTREINDLFKEVYEKIKPSRSIRFCYIEFKEIIQKHNIKTLNEYLRFNRKGMGQPLNPSTRRDLWMFFQEFNKEKSARSLYDFEDRVWILYDMVKKGEIPPMYDSLIIDEAQDLSISRIKLLVSLLKTKENNLMILSDQNQRIYQLNTWRKDVDIDVVGRTFYLSLNYRTSKEIKEYAEKQFIRSEMVKEHIKKYKSLYSGPIPENELFDSYEEQYLWIADKIKGLLKQGLSPYEIGVIGSKRPEDLINVLNKKGIETIVLEGDTYPNMINDKVGITTMHGCKGLEFRAIIVANYQDLYVKRDQSGDLEEWLYEKQQQQLECLKYVACTRAREYLAITAVD